MNSEPLVVGKLRRISLLHLRGGQHLRGIHVRIQQQSLPAWRHARIVLYMTEGALTSLLRSGPSLKSTRHRHVAACGGVGTPPFGLLGRRLLLHSGTKLLLHSGIRRICPVAAWGALALETLKSAMVRPGPLLLVGEVTYVLSSAAGQTQTYAPHLQQKDKPVCQ